VKGKLQLTDQRCLLHSKKRALPVLGVRRPSKAVAERGFRRPWKAVVQETPRFAPRNGRAKKRHHAYQRHVHSPYPLRTPGPLSHVLPRLDRRHATLAKRSPGFTRFSPLLSRRPPNPDTARDIFSDFSPSGATDTIAPLNRGPEDGSQCNPPNSGSAPCGPVPQRIGDPELGSREFRVGRTSRVGNPGSSAAADRAVGRIDRRFRSRANPERAHRSPHAPAASDGVTRRRRRIPSSCCGFDAGAARCCCRSCPARPRPDPPRPRAARRRGTPS